MDLRHSLMETDPRTFKYANVPPKVLRILPLHRDHMHAPRGAVGMTIVDRASMGSLKGTIRETIPRTTYISSISCPSAGVWGWVGGVGGSERFGSVGCVRAGIASSVDDLNDGRSGGGNAGRSYGCSGNEQKGLGHGRNVRKSFRTRASLLMSLTVVVGLWVCSGTLAGGGAVWVSNCSGRVLWDSLWSFYPILASDVQFVPATTPPESVLLPVNGHIPYWYLQFVMMNFYLPVWLPQYKMIMSMLARDAPYPNAYSGNRNPNPPKPLLDNGASGSAPCTGGVGETHGSYPSEQGRLDETHGSYPPVQGGVGETHGSYPRKPAFQQTNPHLHAVSSRPPSFVFPSREEIDAALLFRPPSAPPPPGRTTSTSTPVSTQQPAKTAPTKPE